MSAHTFLVTTHLVVEVVVDTDDERFAYLLDSPREDWSDILQDDLDVPSMAQREIDNGRIQEGWIDVDEVTE